MKKFNAMTSWPLVSLTNKVHRPASAVGATSVVKINFCGKESMILILLMKPFGLTPI
jgi:hypothetical protein